MLANNLQLGETNPSTSTLQFHASRLAALPLIIPAGAGVTEVPIGTLVSIQEYPVGGVKAVVGPVADDDDEYNVGVIIGYGFIEQAEQSEGRGSIAPANSIYKAGDRIAVVTDVNEVYAVPYDTGQTVPTPGIGSAYFNVKGQLTSASGGGAVATKGAVFSKVSGLQLTNQLKTGYRFYRKSSPVEP